MPISARVLPLLVLLLVLQSVLVLSQVRVAKSYERDKASGLAYEGLSVWRSSALNGTLISDSLRVLLERHLEQRRAAVSRAAAQSVQLGESSDLGESTHPSSSSTARLPESDGTPPGEHAQAPQRGLAAEEPVRFLVLGRCSRSDEVIYRFSDRSVLTFARASEAYRIGHIWFWGKRHHLFVLLCRPAAVSALHSREPAHVSALDGEQASSVEVHRITLFEDVDQAVAVTQHQWCSLESYLRQQQQDLVLKSLVHTHSHESMSEPIGELAGECTPTLADWRLVNEFESSRVAAELSTAGRDAEELSTFAAADRLEGSETLASTSSLHKGEETGHEDELDASRSSIHFPISSAWPRNTLLGLDVLDQHDPDEIVAVDGVVHADVAADVDDTSDEKQARKKKDSKKDQDHKKDSKSKSSKSNAAEPRTLSRSLTLTSFNLWNFNEPYLQRLNAICALLSDKPADWVGFQEARYDYYKEWDSGEQYQQSASGSFNGTHRFQVEHLAECLPGHQFAFDPAHTDLHTDTGRFHVDEGLASFSRLPVLASSYLRLTRDFGDEFDAHQRLVQRSLVETSLGPVNLFQTHLSLSPKARLRNVREIWAYVQRFSSPQVLLGDLNATPNDQAIRYLCGKFKQDGESGDFVDAWSLAEDRSVIRSSSEGSGDRKDPDKVIRNGYTFSSFEPNKRIDFFLLRGWDLLPEARVQGFEILGRQTINGSNEAPMYVSDHFPIQLILGERE